MLGYVKIYKPALRIAEFDTYKALYCSLCRNLGKNYGHWLRLTLSYDFTFVTVLALSLQETPCDFKKSRCVYNPFKTCYYNVKYGEVLDRVSAMAALMVWFKIADNIRDEKGLRRLVCRMVAALLSRRMKKARKRFPDVYEALQRLNDRQAEVEQQPETDVDKAAEPSAVALGELCRGFSVTAVDADRLYRIGYCVGKWVYLMDALEDREEDLRRGRFNPISEDAAEDVIATMNVCSNEAGAVFETLPSLYYSGIIKNILYLGLPKQLENFKNKGEKAKNEGSV